MQYGRFQQWVCFSLPLFVSLALGLDQQASASAYQLLTAYDAPSVGDAGAGGAAIANTASTAYANPAGLIRILQPELVANATDISTIADFSGANTWRRSTLKRLTDSSMPM